MWYGYGCRQSSYSCRSLVTYKATVIDVLMTEKIRERGNAEPYSLSKRCKPHVVLLYVIILLTREPCNSLA